MGKPRMTVLAIAIKAAEPLSDEERATLRDVLRPAPKPRQKAGVAKCRLCHKTAGATLHIVGHNRYEHPFESTATSGSKTAQKQKAGKEATAFSNDGDDSMRCRKCKSFFDENVHHLTNRPDYHAFEPAGEASKGASG